MHKNKTREEKKGQKSTPGEKKWRKGQGEGGMEEGWGSSWKLKLWTSQQWQLISAIQCLTI